MRPAWLALPAIAALGLLAFAVVSSFVVEGSVATAFVDASLSWLIVSVAACCVRRGWRHAPTAERAAPRFREAATV